MTLTPTEITLAGFDWAECNEIIDGEVLIVEHLVSNETLTGSRFANRLCRAPAFARVQTVHAKHCAECLGRLLMPRSRING